MSETKTKSDSQQQDTPLADILVNVLAPVLILSKCSRDGESFWHLGPYLAMGLALAIPLIYGIWHFIKVRNGFTRKLWVEIFFFVRNGIIFTPKLRRSKRSLAKHSPDVLLGIL